MSKKPRKRKLLYEEVVQKIKDLIIKGNLKKGDILPSENSLAKKYQVSRVTVRESLKLLADMQIIKTRKGVGSFVNTDINNVDEYMKIYLGDFENSFEEAISIKKFLDPEIAKHLAVCTTKKDIYNLEKILARFDDPIVDNNKFAKLTHSFHIGLIKCLNMPLLTQFYQILEDMENNIDQIRILSNDAQEKIKQKDLEQHWDILNAIKDRNQDLAYSYTKKHLDYFSHYYDKNKKVSENYIIKKTDT